MPVFLNIQIFKWLQTFNLIQGTIINNQICQISFNDQLYLQNGYLIGQLLKNILKSKGYQSESLLKIQLENNQRSRVSKTQILQQIDYEEQIDTHTINFERIQNILQFLYDRFVPKVQNKSPKKNKKLYIDSSTFSIKKPLQQSQNLLQFFILGISKTFNISLNECLGLLIDDCKYFKKLILYGTDNNGFDEIINFYRLIAQNIQLLNKLLSQQNQGSNNFMNTIGLCVLTQNIQIYQLGYIIINNLQNNNWIEKDGCNLMLRSPHDKILNLLLHKIHPNFSILFNNKLSTKFPNKNIQLITYSKLLKYLYKSIYNKQILQYLPLNYYIQIAYNIFQPDTLKQQQIKIKLNSKYLLTILTIYFWNKLQYQYKNKILFCFNYSLCKNQQQKISTLTYLFQIINQFSIKEIQFIYKFYKIINQYYHQANLDIRTYIFHNLIYLYQHHPHHFPIGYFLETYQISNPVQTTDYQLIQLISKSKSLQPQEAMMLLKICTIYYYQQLQAACFLQPIKNIIQQYNQIQWATQLSQQILNKWPSLPIPPFQMIAPNTNKIKFRSIGIKKKQMLQFTQLNRYKNVLKLLTNIKNRQFLIIYGQKIGSTIIKVQKSKSRQMQNTKIFLNKLLCYLDKKIIQLKQQNKIQLSLSKQSNIRSSQLSNQLDYDPFLQQYNQNQIELQTPIQHLKSINQSIYQSNKQSINSLLPFTQQSIIDYNQKKYSQNQLFQNYQIIYLKNIAKKYQSLLLFITQRYQKSANITHFLKNINILSYFEKQINILQSTQKRLKLIHQNPKIISNKLTIELAFLLFQFKKSRRITIKCVQSFYDLLKQKNQEILNQFQADYTPPNQGVAINAKVQFKYEIASKNIQCNKSISNYITCFEVVSQILKKAIGIHEIEPISCVISQIIPHVQTNNISSSSNLMKNMKNSQISHIQQKQYEQLQKMIQKQPQIAQPKNIYSTPLKRNKYNPSYHSNEREAVVDPKSNQYEKWAEVQKKVIMRRRELQNKQKSINES